MLIQVVSLEWKGNASYRGLCFGYYGVLTCTVWHLSELKGGELSFGWRDVVRARELLNFLVAGLKMGWFYSLPCLVRNMAMPLGPRSFFLNGTLDVVVVCSFWVSSSLHFQEFVMVPVIFSGICFSYLSQNFLRVERCSLRSEAHYLYPWFLWVLYSRGSIVIMGVLLQW